MPKQKCPLCDGIAGCGGIDYGRKIQFKCSNCKVFVISYGRESEIGSLSEWKKQGFISQSQNCPEEYLLHITKNKEGKFDARCRLKSDFL
ncbi:MAG: hypothetical protein GY730_02900 [bacterium]|nr:hypothetical protein [bacterium]